LTNGDGMLLVGRTLYVVQNRLNQLAVLRLNAHGTRGSLVDTLRDPRLDVPTTVAAARGALYLPNARFGAASPGTIDYAVIRVER
ncbi:MAG: superoxide dismutase, partial [Friedmanniella sp.]|nr:superoxide dismutase [Friedmanniella sp.]